MYVLFRVLSFILKNGMPRLSGREAAERLKKMGIPLEPVIEEYLRHLDYTARHLAEVYQCPKCGEIYESNVPLQEVSCRISKHQKGLIPNMKKIWSDPKFR